MSGSRQTRLALPVFPWGETRFQQMGTHRPIEEDDWYRPSIHHKEDANSGTAVAMQAIDVAFFGSVLLG